MDPICFTPIGIIRTPFTEMAGMPVQAAGAHASEGRIELDPAFAEGLRDIESFTHLILLYHLHQMRGAQLVVTSFLDSEPHGVFATRAPKRPNPIGLSTVRLVRVEGTILHIQDVDMLDGTPLLDMKPYVPPFDDRANVRIGWYEGKLERLGEVRADDRFR